MDLPVIDRGILDKQHDYLIKLLERYEGAKVSKLEVAAGAKALLLYAMEHFHTEEKLMRDEGYPEVDRHHDMHSHFRTLCENMVIEGTDLEFNKLISNMKNWLVSHIQVQDTKYSTWRDNRVMV